MAPRFGETARVRQRARYRDNLKAILSPSIMSRITKPKIQA